MALFKEMVSMSIRFFFELIGDYDSYELYKALKWAKVNVTDMIEHTMFMARSLH